MKYLVLLALSLNTWNSMAQEEASETELSQAERQEIKQRIQQFYKKPSAQQMNQYIPKYNVLEEKK